jgi:DNA topoisomerase IA
MVLKSSSPVLHSTVCMKQQKPEAKLTGWSGSMPPRDSGCPAEDVYYLGRVQTPTLALISKRFEDHQNFQQKKDFQIQLKH